MPRLGRVPSNGGFFSFSPPSVITNNNIIPLIRPRGAGVHSRPGSTAFLPLLITHTRGPQKNKRFGSHGAPQNSVCCPCGSLSQHPHPAPLPSWQDLATLLVPSHPAEPPNSAKGGPSGTPMGAVRFLSSREVAEPLEASPPRCPCTFFCSGTMPWMSPLHRPCPQGVRLRGPAAPQDAPAEPQCFV